MDRSTVIAYIFEALRSQIEAKGVEEPPELNELTALIGAESPIDSMGLVGVIVELEERLESEHGVAVILADERAMSQRNSPFRTVGTLADYAELIASGDLHR